jgi:hypothetical protein
MNFNVPQQLPQSSPVTMNTAQSPNNEAPTSDNSRNHLRFHLPFAHMLSVFDDDWFALKTEAFARFFGTPIFLISQTFFVAI